MFRFYCTITDLRKIAPLGFRYVSDALDAIRQASQFLEGESQLDGNFYPVTDTRSFDGDGSIDLYLRNSPILSVTSITMDTTTLTSSDYLLYPLNKCWAHGPYTRIQVDPDASNLVVWTNERDIVSISATFGKYDNSIDTGEDITQTASATTLTATNGANIEVGMVLLIESEQEAVTGIEDPTVATSLVDGAIVASDANITVDDASEFNRGEVIKIGTEQMLIEDTDTDNEVLYVIRAYNGTRAQAHNDDSAISVYRTYTVERGINGTTAAAHASKSVYQYLPPFDVRWLCKQIAGLMIKKEASHFAGKVGNADLGEVFYMDEYPKSVLEKTRMNYFTRSMT